MTATDERLLNALAANTCPVCKKRHLKGTAILSRHAARLERESWYGYSYEREAWLRKDEAGTFVYVTNAELEGKS